MDLSFIKNNDIRDTCESILKFLRHPIEQVKFIPDWSWRRVLISICVLSALSGFLKNLIIGSSLIAVLSIISNPILTLLMILTSCVFFYYSLQVFLNKTVDFKKLFVLLFFANLPLIFFQVLAEVIAPVTLIGLLFSCFITIVGIHENFGVEKKWAFRIVGAAYGVLFAVWIAGQIKSLRLEEKFESKIDKAPMVELNK
jgi:hypothetical protein